ncbi:uncharacterized protein TRIADDRAFT_20959, partial [Trichoplax adhaerens]
IFTDRNLYTLVDDLYYELKGKVITEEAGEIDDAAIGNSSAGKVESAGAAVTGIDFVLQNRLVETGFSSVKDFKKYIKDYIAKIVTNIKDHNPDRVEIFKKKVNVKMAEIIKTFSDWKFFMVESMDAEALHVLVKEDGKTAIGLVWKDGVKEEK